MQTHNNCNQVLLGLSIRWSWTCNDCAFKLRSKSLKKKKNAVKLLAIMSIMLMLQGLCWRSDNTLASETARWWGVRQKTRHVCEKHKPEGGSSCYKETWCSKRKSRQSVCLHRNLIMISSTLLESWEMGNSIPEKAIPD